MTNTILTVKTLCEKYPAFTQGGIRSMIFNNSNDFNKCTRRVGRKILIMEFDFLSWVDSLEKTDGLSS